MSDPIQPDRTVPRDSRHLYEEPQKDRALVIDTPPIPDVPKQVDGSSELTGAEGTQASETGAEFEMAKERDRGEQEGFIDEAIEGLRKRLRKPKKSTQTTIPQVRDQLTVQIEKVMEEGLADAYKSLSTIEQQEFKIKGEETALQIRALLQQTRIKVKKIFFLVLEWLKYLPGINRFFLEQEAKIKTDKIIALKEIFDKRFH